MRTATTDHITANIGILGKNFRSANLGSYLVDVAGCKSRLKCTRATSPMGSSD